MTQEPNYPMTSSGDPRTTPEADRPAPGPEAAGDPGATFPRDESLDPAPGAGGSQQTADPGLAGRERQGASERPAWGQGGAGGGVGAPQAVDPGLADQEAGGPAGQPSWGRGATRATESASPRDGNEMGPESARPATSGTGVEEPSLDRFRERWPAVQGAFVDDPRNAVAEADRLVAEVIQEVEQRLTRRRREVEAQMSGGEQDTEQLRRTMHGYRALFHRLLESEF